MCCVALLGEKCCSCLLHMKVKDSFISEGEITSNRRVNLVKMIEI